MTRGRRDWVVIGVGNAWRRDDAAGLEVARLLRRLDPPGVSVLELTGEPATLIDSWAGAGRVLVVDSVSSGLRPGSLHAFEAAGGPLPAELFRSSTHVLGVAEAIELARELGRLPDRLVVYGIEGESFGPGEGLTPDVRAEVERLASELNDRLPGPGGDLPEPASRGARNA